MARLSKDQVEQRRAALIEIVAEVTPCTVRQVYYQATVRGIVDKTENGYWAVQEDLVRLRNEGRVSFDDIVDNTRTRSGAEHERKDTRTLDSYDVPSADDIILQWIRRDIAVQPWALIDYDVQVWLEKDALSGVLNSTCAELAVPLFPARGYSSLTFVYDAAQLIEKDTCYVYHLGDYDPSGQDAARDIKAKLAKYRSDVEFHFTQLAVTPQQIEDWELPSRPTKKSTHAKSTQWEGDSVELDAIHPDTLRNLVSEAILQHYTDEIVAEAESLTLDAQEAAWAEWERIRDTD